ncbi:MAG: DUF4445 domain-containing protein [Deltaproteobacteria bacterium]|nr:DUF4445 domain-containing protein [Deltaproteobacteria bacterium]
MRGLHDKDNTWIRLLKPALTPPSLKDNTADVDRVIKATKKALGAGKVRMDFSLMKKAPSFLRDHGYDVWGIAYEDGLTWRLVELLPPGGARTLYGLAIDLGSATIVLQLLDLLEGQALEEVSLLNPQVEVGLDILTRIQFACQDGGLEELKSMLLEVLNREIAGLRKKHNIKTETMAGASVAGNTTMTHLLLGLDPYWICREPYIPAINRPGILRAREIGLDIFPDAPVLLFPNAGSYFGGDMIAGILASGMAQSDAVCLLVDVGTNAEVVLGNKDWLVACAGAAGSALEGGVAEMGTMAGPGVIDRVSIDRDRGEFKIHTISDRAPVGICGSGLIDLVAQLFLAGMIDVQGRFVKERCGSRLKETEGINHLVVVPSGNTAAGREITLSQTDLDRLLRSKAAMYTILTTLLDMMNLEMGDISRFYVAGTFGSYIDPRSAITIGMLPDLPLETYESLGNTSLAGARKALLSQNARDMIYEIQERITYIELNVNQEFMNRFSAARFIPHTDMDLFPSVKK